jgi:predicted deacetylase
MKAQYLLRFEDICPTMNWAVWDRIEEILQRRRIHPVLAVVPDNRDPQLQVCPPRMRFWDRVREWQSNDWTIGMHGWQHVFVTRDPGIVRLADRSEFAGLPRPAQRRKLLSARGVFQRENIGSSLWIAPAHSFDVTTLELLPEFGFRYVSDGFSIYPHVDEFGLTWLPQQLWDFRRRPFGTWTISFHINQWTDADVEQFDRDAERYGELISSFEAIVQKDFTRQSSVWRSAASGAYRCVARVKTFV